MWPTRAFCAVRDAVSEFSCDYVINIYIIYVIVYSSVFKRVRLASEQVPNERTYGKKWFAYNSFPSAESIYNFLILLHLFENTGRFLSSSFI